MPIQLPRYDPRTGGSNLTASTYNKLFRQIEIGSKITADPPLEITQCGETLSIRLATQTFYAKITSGSNPYAWSEVQSDGSGGWEDVTGGRSGTTTENPIYDIDGATLPADTIALVFATEDGTFWCDAGGLKKWESTLGQVAVWSKDVVNKLISTNRIILTIGVEDFPTLGGFLTLSYQTASMTCKAIADVYQTATVTLSGGAPAPSFIRPSINLAATTPSGDSFHTLPARPDITIFDETYLGGLTVSGYTGLLSGARVNSGLITSVTGYAAPAVSDGDKGDVTVSGSGAVWTIDNGVVSTAKMGGDVTTAGKALLDDANAAAQRTTLGLGTSAVIDTGTSGTKVPLLDGANSWSASQTFLNSSGIKVLDTDASHTLGIIGGTNLSANRTFTLTTGDAARTLDISAADVTVSGFVATLTDDADQATARTTLGVGTGDSPQFTALNVGAATDTTLTRVSAGVVAVEGATVATLSTAQTWSASQTFANSSGIKIQDTDASHTLGLVGGSDLSANRTLTVTTGDASRTLTLTGDTSLGGTNTGDQNLFSTIAVSGQSDVVADSTSDTLTLAAGSGITLTTNASTDTVTIAASGVVTSVFTRTGAVVAASGDYTAAQVTNAVSTIGQNTITNGGDQTIIRTSASDTGAAPVLNLDRNTTAAGGPNANFGGQLAFRVETSTTESQTAAEIETIWPTITHASRKARVIHRVYDTAAREAIRIEASGTAAMIGFLGANAAVAQTGDAGTALVTFGLMTGTPTFAGANISGTATIPAAAYPTFVQAGGSAAKGAVPAPGATAHTNDAYFLGDDAAWHVRTGSILGYNLTTTAESTSSASFVDLATAQSITFTLDDAADVLVCLSTILSNTSAAAANRVAADVNGSDTALMVYTNPAANSNYGVSAQYKFSLSSGSNTIKMQFDVGAGTCTFSNRMMTIIRLS